MLMKQKVDSTYVVSVFCKPTYVTMNQLLNNQQVTKDIYFNRLVGTSEAECSQTLSNEEFNEWLAGLIDGDGCFLVSKQGYTSCEITAGLKDEPMLLYIKNRLGGSVKLRSGCRAVRWRLQYKLGMMNLVNIVNGFIRNSKRTIQLQRVCEILNIVYKEPLALKHNSAWYAGFFDAEGTLTYSIKGVNKQLQCRISATNCAEKDIIMFQERFGGSVYFDRSQNGYYSWSISNKDHIKDFLNYSKICTFRSMKGKRLLLVPQLIEFSNSKAFKADINSAQYKAWSVFAEKWARF
jgi:ubiquinol-cytochrome c reductase cytochrome b subunit